MLILLTDNMARNLSTIKGLIESHDAHLTLSVVDDPTLRREAMRGDLSRKDDAILIRLSSKSGHLHKASHELQEVMVYCQHEIRVLFRADAFPRPDGGYRIEPGDSVPIQNYWKNFDQLEEIDLDALKKPSAVVGLINFKKYSFSKFQMHGLDRFDVSIPQAVLIDLFPEGLPIKVPDASRIRKLKVSYKGVWRKDSLQSLCLRKLYESLGDYPGEEDMRVMCARAKQPIPWTQHVVRE